MVGAIALEAPAKLNLFLRVIGRRADGYHLLQSLVAFLDLRDRVELAPAPAWRVRVRGPFAAAVPAEDNLALRAGRLMADAAAGDVAGCAALAADIWVEKNIPVAAGLGGGSADAAAVLHGLSRMWGLGLPLAELQRIGARLGADLPACLAGSPALVTGIGESVEPVALAPLSLVLVNPGLPLSTAEVFSRLIPPYAEPLAMPEALASAADVVREAARFGNSLQAAAIALRPTIAAVLDEIAGIGGCLLAQMSGSGATCFGVFADEAAARAGADGLAARRPGWFVRACRSLPGPAR